MSKKFIYVNAAGDYEETLGAYEIADHISSSAGVADAGKPIVLNAQGKVDPSMVPFEGLTWKTPARVASVANVNLASAPAAIDGVTLVSGNRVLIKEQTLPEDNGIYTFASAGNPLVRSYDFDEPGEVVGGTVLVVEEGTVNADKMFIVTTDNPITIGTSPIIFNTVPFNTFTGGNGITITGNDISVDLLNSGSGLQFAGGGADELAIQFASVFTIDAADALAPKASDYASTTNGKGASIVGIEDASAYYSGNSIESALNELEAQLGGATSSTYNFTENNVLADNDAIYPALNKLDLKFGDIASTAVSEGASLVGINDAGSYYTSTNVEGALQEIGALIVTPGVSVTATTALNKGDVVFFSSNNAVSKYSTITATKYGLGLAATTVSAAATVQIANDQSVLTGVLSGAVAGNKYFWTGSALSLTAPSASGSYVYQVGYAKNATDLFVDVALVKKNS